MNCDKLFRARNLNLVHGYIISVFLFWTILCDDNFNFQEVYPYAYSSVIN